MLVLLQRPQLETKLLKVQHVGIDHIVNVSSKQMWAAAYRQRDRQLLPTVVQLAG